MTLPTRWSSPLFDPNTPPASGSGTGMADPKVITNLVSNPGDVDLDKQGIVIDGKRYTAAEFRTLTKEHESLKAAKTELETKLSATEKLRESVRRFYGDPSASVPAATLTADYRTLLVDAGWTGQKLEDEIIAYEKTLSTPPPPADPKKKGDPEEDPEDDALRTDVDATKRQLKHAQDLIAEQMEERAAATVELGLGDPTLKKFLDAREKMAEEDAEELKVFKEEFIPSIQSVLRTFITRAITARKDADPNGSIKLAWYREVLPDAVAATVKYARRMLGNPDKIGRAYSTQQERELSAPFEDKEPEGPKRGMSAREAEEAMSRVNRHALLRAARAARTGAR